MSKPVVPAVVRNLATARRQAALSWQIALADGPPIAAVVCDLFGTLLQLDGLADACRELTADPAPLVTLWRAKQLEGSWQRTVQGRYADFAQVTHEALDYALSACQLTATPAVRRRLVAAWSTLPVYPDAPDLLTRLADLPLAILSNATPMMLHTALTHHRLSASFAAVLSADAARAYKPAPAVYALAPAALALPKEQILFVSANSWDAAGAKAYGLRVAWCNRANQPPEYYAPAPDLIVSSLADIAVALRR